MKDMYLLLGSFWRSHLPLHLLWLMSFGCWDGATYSHFSRMGLDYKRQLFKFSFLFCNLVLVNFNTKIFMMALAHVEEHFRSLWEFSFSSSLVGCSVVPLAGELWIFPLLHNKVSSPAGYRLQAIEWYFKICHMLRFSFLTYWCVLHFKVAILSVNTGKGYALSDWIQLSSAGPEMSEQCHTEKWNSWLL